MPSCSVFCCKKRSNTSSLQKDGVTFHIFPKDRILRKMWKTFCNNKITWIPTRTSAICSIHFKASDFQVLANNRRKLVEGAKPTLTPNCICSVQTHHQSFDNPDDPSTSTYDASSANVTLPDSMPCTSILQNDQSKESSTKFSLNPTVALTPRERRMQHQLDCNKKKIKRLQAKNLYLKKKVSRLEEILENLDEEALIDTERLKIIC